MRLGVVSDLHFTADPAARAAWHNEYDFAGVPARLGDAAAAFADVDAVIALGDLTHSGDEASARAAFERLAALRRPVLVVAGNHDCRERDDRLERCVDGSSEMLTAAGVELGGTRVAGVSIERPKPGTFRWVDAPSPGDGPTVVVSHFPVISRQDRFAERGLAYPGDLVNRGALHERLRGGGPLIVLSGHIHARESHARDTVLQLSAGALVEAPYEIAIVDVSVSGGEVRVRRRAQVLGPPPAGKDPVLAPADETWTYGSEGWLCAS